MEVKWRFRFVVVCLSAFFVLACSNDPGGSPSDTGVSGRDATRPDRDTDVDSGAGDAEPDPDSADVDAGDTAEDPVQDTETDTPAEDAGDDVADDPNPDPVDDAPTDAVDVSDVEETGDATDVSDAADDTTDVEDTTDVVDTTDATDVEDEPLPDRDGDGKPDESDPCPDDNPDDPDDDGVCTIDDVCLSGDDNVDLNDNGVPDACDAEPGFYTYQRLPIGGIEESSAVDFHPDNGFFVFTESSGPVHIYDVATSMTESVTLNPGGTPYWTDVRFAPDGSYAILVGGITQDDGGVVYRFDTASYLDPMTDTAEAFVRLDAWESATAAYTTVQYHPDTGIPWLLAYWGTGGDIFTLLTLDPMADTVDIVVSENAGDPCTDMAFVNNEFGSPGVLVSCSYGPGLRYYTELGGVWEMRNGFHTTSTNMGDVAAPPDQSHALILANFIGGAYEFRQGQMSESGESFRSNTSQFLGIEFSPDGQRALVLGDYESIFGTVVGRIFEYRTGFYDCSAPGNPDCGWTDASITNYAEPPFNAESGYHMNDLAWRYDCDGGVIVGGFSNFAGSTGHVITFERIGGVDCWD